MVRYLLLSCAIAAALVVPASAANLLVNGGFEDGSTGSIGNGVPNWSNWGSSGWHHDDAGKVIGSKAIKFWWDDAGVWQDFTVTGNGQYAYSMQAFNSSSDPLVGWNGILKAEFYNSALGTDPANKLGEAVVDKFYSASDPRDQWVTISGAVTAPANADIGRIILMIADWQPGVGGSLNFDEASVTLVPEPITAVLLGLALVAGRRRK